MIIFALCIIVVILIGTISFFAVQHIITQYSGDFIIRDAADAPKCDAIMVLGAQVSDSGSPSYILRDRLDYGRELYAAGAASKILVSGDHGQKDYDEVNAMKDYLIDKGVPGGDIFMDHAGFNTYDSMYRAKAVFCVESLLIATQEFHIGRSVYIARKLGINAYGYPCEDKPFYRMRYLRLRESLARAKAFLDVAVNRKPKYLGDAIPISGDGGATDG